MLLASWIPVPTSLLTQTTHYIHQATSGVPIQMHKCPELLMRKFDGNMSIIIIQQINPLSCMSFAVALLDCLLELYKVDAISKLKVHAYPSPTGVYTDSIVKDTTSTIQMYILVLDTNTCANVLAYYNTYQ